MYCPLEKCKKLLSASTAATTLKTSQRPMNMGLNSQIQWLSHIAAAKLYLGCYVQRLITEYVKLIEMEYEWYHD